MISIILIILMALFSFIFLIVGAVVISIHYNEMRVGFNYKWYTNSWVLACSALIYFLIVLTTIFLVVESKQTPPKYQLVTEPVYKQIK